MKVEEFRIGNYFYVEKSSCLFDKGIQKVKFDTFNDIRFYNALESMRPIELTEEILLKCGFSKTNRKIEIKMSLSTFNWHSSDPNFIFIDIDGYNDMGIECKHLHQLQNLYFALTNEELNIQL